MGTVQIVIILSMLGVNSLFAGFELALASVSLGRLRGLAEQGRRGAGAALAMKARMEASLAVVQIGMTLATSIAAATGGAEAGEFITPWIEEAFGAPHQLAYVLAIALVVLPLSALMIVVGELVPKTLGIKHPEWVCLTLSPIMRVAAWVFYPPVLAFEAVTRGIVRLVERRLPESMGRPYEIGLAELRAQTNALRTGRIIGAEQERIILGASDLSTTKVKDIAVAPGEIVMLNADAPLTDHFVIVHLEAYTRFPVTERPGDPQGIIGYVNLKELIFLAKMFPTNPSLRQITRRLIEVSPEAKVGDAFARMMREHAHLALVRDEAGAVGGIITLEDILEEVVGDIQDEFDRIPRHITAAGSQWVVGGGATLARLREATARADLGAPEPPETAFTDWARRHHPAPVRGGDSIVIGAARILIRKVRRQRILEALLEFGPEGQAPSADNT